LHDLQQSVQSPAKAGFVVQPKRWVARRTHAWGKRWRRMVMMHGRKTSTCVAWVWLAKARVLLNRLANLD